MLEVIAYKVSYRPEDDAGMVHLALENDQATDVYVDSPQELSLMLDILRHEKPVFYDLNTRQILTGFEAVGEAE